MARQLGAETTEYRRRDSFSGPGTKLPGKRYNKTKNAPGFIFQQSSRIAVVYQLLCSCTMANRLSYDWIAKKNLDGLPDILVCHVVNILDKHILLFYAGIFLHSNCLRVFLPFFSSQKKRNTLTILALDQILFCIASRIRVDLLSYESKLIDKQKQYNWRGEINLDGHWNWSRRWAKMKINYAWNEHFQSLSWQNAGPKNGTVPRTWNRRMQQWVTTDDNSKEEAEPVQIFLSPLVILPSFISRFALVW